MWPEVIAAILGAVLAWGTKTWRERRARRNEMKVESLENAAKAQKHRADKFRSSPSKLVSELPVHKRKAILRALPSKPNRPSDQFPVRDSGEGD